MQKLLDSIGKYGILTPLIVRPVPEGVYEIISGAEELSEKPMDPPKIISVVSSAYNKLTIKWEPVG